MGETFAFAAFKTLAKQDARRASIGAAFGWLDCKECNRPYHGSHGRYCPDCTGAT